VHRRRHGHRHVHCTRLMLALLAPVPAKILEDGFAVSNPSGFVAFGTGELGEEKSGAWSFEFFSKEELAEGKGVLPVLIFGSSTDLQEPHPMHRPGFVTAIGTYQGITEAKNYRHPDPSLRPKAALEGDTRWAMFWEVSNLKRLAKLSQIPLKRLKLRGKGRLASHSGESPRGPLLVVLPDEFAMKL
jgi:hypothetical protein